MNPSIAINNNLRRRLSSAEDELLSAMEQGPSAMQEFETTWLSLQMDIDQAIHSSQVEEDTLSLIHAVASRVVVLTDRMLELESKCDTLSITLQAELDNVFSRFNAQRPSHADTTSSLLDDGAAFTKSHYSSLLDSAENAPDGNCENTSCPPYIACAYHWLMRNLHNPYPSSEVKQMIARRSATSVDKIGGWFTHVRQRIGWTSISRKFYSNCRADIIDGAYRCFIEDDPQRPLEAGIAYEFMVMKAVAEGLYSAKFKKSTLAKKLDSVLKDMTDSDRRKLQELKERAIQEKINSKESEKHRARVDRAKVRALVESDMVRKVPDPVCGSPSCENNDDEVNAEVGRRIRKRRSSSISSGVDVDQEGREMNGRRQTKRLKVHDIDDSLDYSAETLYGEMESSTTPSDASVTSTDSSDEHLLSRKRRLSSGDLRPMKRPRGCQAGPRGAQCVSDPFPMSLSADDINEWFQYNFELPDQSKPWDLTVFSDWSSLDTSGDIEGKQRIASGSSLLSLSTDDTSDDEPGPPTPPSYDTLYLPAINGSSRYLPATISILPDIAQNASHDISTVPNNMSVAGPVAEPPCDYQACYSGSYVAPSDVSDPSSGAVDPSELLAVLQDFDHSSAQYNVPYPSDFVHEIYDCQDAKQKKFAQLQAHRDAAEQLERELLNIA